VLVATGLVDEPPDDGPDEQWGRGIVHCPFCHGFEVRDQALVQIVTSAVAPHRHRSGGTRATG
jgi:thioredoxin reductase